MGTLDVARRLDAQGFEVEVHRDLFHWVNRMEVHGSNGRVVWFSGEPEAAGEPPYAVWTATDASDLQVVATEAEVERCVLAALRPSADAAAEGEDVAEGGAGDLPPARVPDGVADAGPHGSAAGVVELEADGRLGR